MIFSVLEGRRVTDLLASLMGLSIFSLLSLVRSNVKALCLLLALVTCGTATLGLVAYHYDTLRLSPVVWLFVQSLSLYLSFQTLFFERFIACFRIRGNVGFFIITLDFIGYAGTVLVLVVKEWISPDVVWLDFYNSLSAYVGVFCAVAFCLAGFCIVRRYRRENGLGVSRQTAYCLLPVQNEQ